MNRLTGGGRWIDADFHDAFDGAVVFCTDTSDLSSHILYRLRIVSLDEFEIYVT